MSGSNAEHSARHDLESVFYVFLYICTMYGGPGRLRRNPGLDDNHHPFGDWLDKMDINWHSIAALRIAAFTNPEHTRKAVFKHVHPYFSPLILMLNSLCNTVYKVFMQDGPDGARVGGRGPTQPCGTHVAVLDVLKATFDKLPDHDDDTSGWSEEERQASTPWKKANYRGVDGNVDPITRYRHVRDIIHGPNSGFEERASTSGSLCTDFGHVVGSTSAEAADHGDRRHSHHSPNKRGSYQSTNTDVPPSKCHCNIKGRFTSSSA
jgi:hypothetical protein